MQQAGHHVLRWEGGQLSLWSAEGGQGGTKVGAAAVAPGLLAGGNVESRQLYDLYKHAALSSA